MRSRLVGFVGERLFSRRNVVLDAGHVEIDELDGRYLETTCDFDAGYYWFDQLSRVGFFIDKVLALQALVDPETGILGQDTEADVRGFQINFASTGDGSGTANKSSRSGTTATRTADRPRHKIAHPTRFAISESA